MLELVEEEEQDSESNEEAKEAKSKAVTWTINNYKNKRNKKMGTVHASIRTVFNYVPRAGGEAISRQQEKEIEKYYKNLSLKKEKANGTHSQS